MAKKKSTSSRAATTSPSTHPPTAKTTAKPTHNATQKETKKPEAVTTAKPTTAPTQNAPLQITNSPAPQNKSEPPKTTTEPQKTTKTEPQKMSTEVPKAAKTAPPKTATEPKKPNTEPPKAKTDAFEKPQKTEFVYKEDRKEALQVLGLDEKASKEDIRKAYLKEALAHHPDKNGDVSKFRQAKNAYDYLADTNEKPEDPNVRKTTPDQPRANQQPNTSRPTHSSQPQRAAHSSRTSPSFNPPPSRSYASQHTSNTHSPPQRANHHRSNQPPRPQAPRQQQPINLSPMAQTQQPTRHEHNSYHHLAMVQRKNEEKIGHILNNNHFSSPPRRIREPGSSNEKIVFGNANDALTFASAAAKEGVAFQIKDSKSNILAYSNGDGKLYTGKHTEYKPGQKLDPVSPRDFQIPRSPQMGM